MLISFSDWRVNTKYPKGIRQKVQVEKDLSKGKGNSRIISTINFQS